MPTCPAIKRNGVVCGHGGNHFENHCGTHFNSRRVRDAEYRARYEAHINAVEEQRQVSQQQRAEAIERSRAEREAAIEENRRQATRTRDEMIERNQRLIDSAPTLSPYAIILYVQRLMYVWKTERIPGYDCVKAYAFVKYQTSNHIGYPNLMRAAIKVYLQTAGHHPEHDMYINVPAEERQQALADITTALVPYGDIDYKTLISVSDKYYTDIQNRIRADAEAVAVAIAAEEARIAAAARRAQLLVDLRERPVVFSRDPEGSINLAAFANDNQSVHRSSVQASTHKAIMTLISRPLVDGQDTLPEILSGFNDTQLLRFTAGTRERTVTEITNDYFNTEAFSVMYGNVLDHVWAYIREHAEKNELIIRLAQEVVEGVGQCGNGKMARLVNVLSGYDETLEANVPTRELFMARFSLLTKRPFEEREALARTLFEEFSIPAEEQNTWLEPLLEA